MPSWLPCDEANSRFRGVVSGNWGFAGAVALGVAATNGAVDWDRSAAGSDGEEGREMTDA